MSTITVQNGSVTKASILALIVFPLFRTALSITTDSKIGSKIGDEGQLKERESILRKPILTSLESDSKSSIYTVLPS